MDDSTHFNRVHAPRGARPRTGPLYWGAQSPSQYSGMTPVQLGAWTPCTKEGSQVGARGDTVAVEVRAATGARTPCAEHLTQVCAVNNSIAIEVHCTHRAQGARGNRIQQCGAHRCRQLHSELLRATGCLRRNHYRHLTLKLPSRDGENS